MDPLGRQGRNQTIAIFSSVLLISIYIILFYQLYIPALDNRKLFQQITRFLLTILLMYCVFLGKNWARITMGVLMILGALLGLGSLFIPVDLASKVPLIVMTVIYSVSIYHLFFSKSFKAYFSYLSTHQQF